MKKILTLLSALLISLFLSSCIGGGDDTSPSKEEETSQQEGQQKIILALGDSLTAGYSLPIEDSYPSQLEGLLEANGYDYRLINAGVSGDTSAQALKRLDLYLEDEEEIPDIAIVVLGGNDGLRGQSIDELEKNLTTIVGKLQQENITVILGGMQIPPNRGFKYFSEFKGVYKKVAKATDSERIPFFLEDVAGMGVYNLPDKIHPNKDGYAIVAENTFNFLKKNKLIEND